MTAPGEQDKNGEELRAPEVVKPLASNKCKEQLGRDTRNCPATKSRQEPHAEDMAHGKRESSPSSATPRRPQLPATPPPLPARSNPARSLPPGNKINSSPSNHRVWIAISATLGVLLLIRFAELTLKSTQSTPNQSSNSYIPPTATVTPRQSSPDISSKSNAAVESHVGSEVLRHILPSRVTPKAKPRGSIRLSAFMIAADGQRQSVDQVASVEFRNDDKSFVASSNTTLPARWYDLPPGQHAIKVAVPGYRNSTTNVVVTPGCMDDIAIGLNPIPARVRFEFPVTNVVFDVWNDTRRLGDSRTEWNLQPFVSHYLTFKANGWRPQRFKITPSEPGKSYRYKIGMERVSADLRVTVSARRGDSPKRGRISINGSKFADVEFPIERRALPVSGPMTLALEVDGFTVLDSTQTVVLVDRELTEVVFKVEKRSWVSRIFGRSEKPRVKE